MLKSLRFFAVSLLLLAANALQAQNVGIGTAAPAQKLEIAGTNNTIRINGLKTGGNYNGTAATSSNILYVNNTTGDVYALPSGGVGAILTINASGIPTWSTGATSATAWQLTGNTGIATPAAPATYGTSTITSGKNWLGTTDGNDVVFGTDNIERMRIGGGTVATAGDVGIGTSAPATTLHVVQIGNHTSDFGTYNVAVQIENKSGTEPILYINGSTANNPLAGIIERASSTAFYSGLNNSANYRIAGIASITSGAVTTAKDGTAGITVLESNGNVGLNYTTPANALDISGAEAIGSYAGTAAPSNGLIVSGNVGIGTSSLSSGSTLNVVQNGNVASDFGGYNTAVEIQNTAGTEPVLYINGSTANNPLAGIVQRGSSTAFYEGLNNNANFRIAGITAISQTGFGNAKDGSAGITVLESNGNVGIGIIAPAQALQVVGSVQFSQALMPNGAAGTAGNVLLSGGAGTFPTWLANGSANQVLTISGGVPTWVTPTATSATAWQLTGNAIAYTFSASPTNYLGTTASNGAGFQFGVGGANAGRVESTNGNTALGYQTLNATTGTYNVAMGYQTSNSTITGQYNTALGYQSYLGPGTTSGSYNIAIGYQALNTTVWGTNVNTASNNIAIGNQSLTSITTSHDEIGIGNSAGAAIITGTQNIAIGYAAMYNTGGGDNNNTAIGYLALEGFGANVNDNTAIGTNALQNGASSDNVAIGYNSMEENFLTSVGFNVAVGSGTLQVGNTVSNSTAIGYYSLHTATAGNNTAVGYSSLSSNLSGSSNVAMGYDVLLSNTSGSNNTALGYQAGYTATPANANVTGSNNTFIGYNAGPGTATQLSNATALGNGALAPISNSITLGNSAATSLYIPGYQTAGALLYTTAATGLVGSTGVGTSGQVLESTGGGAPTWTTLTTSATAWQLTGNERSNLCS